MTPNDISIELQEMREQMQTLKGIIHDQQIVNENMMRRAMKKDFGEMRSKVCFSTTLSAFTCMFLTLFLILVFLLQAKLFIPLWLYALSVLFLWTATAASVYALRRYLPANLLTGNLTNVAATIVSYKRFRYKWLKFAIPFLLAWFTALFYYIGRDLDSAFSQTLFCGCLAGLVIGCILDFFHFMKSQKRLNDLLRDIEEVRGTK